MMTTRMKSGKSGETCLSAGKGEASLARPVATCAARRNMCGDEAHGLEGLLEPGEAPCKRGAGQHKFRAVCGSSRTKEEASEPGPARGSGLGASNFHLGFGL